MLFVDEIKVKIEEVKTYVFKHYLSPVMRFADKLNYPGEENISLLDIGKFFFIGLQKGDIQARARSIAFDFFLAIFPSIIFFFTLIPYIPVEGFQDRILLLLQEVLPHYSYEAAESTIIDILNQEHSGLLSFGFLFALWVSTNGINSMIESFNASYHGIQVRSVLKQRLVSIFLTLMLAIIMIFSIALIVFAEIASNYLANTNLVNSGFNLFLLHAGTWMILLAMALTMISFLYFFGPSKKNKRPFISVGSVAATILVLATTFAFNYFIAKFGQYNKLYGSIGALIVILLWINFNSLMLIIGFELNASIENAQQKAIKGKQQRNLAAEEKIHRSM